MSSANLDNETSPSAEKSGGFKDRLKRWAISAGIVVVAFLLGFVPMWWSGRTKAQERDSAQAALRVSAMRNSLADAVIDARRGEYEPARQSASEFYTALLAEFARGSESVFNETQKGALKSVFDTRDETITLLARSDPASADRLTQVYGTLRQASASR